MNTNNRRDTYIDSLGTKGKTPFGSILQILKGKVADPNIGSAKTVKILNALRRQIDFVSSDHNPNLWYEKFKALNDELRALALSNNDE